MRNVFFVFFISLISLNFIACLSLNFFGLGLTNHYCAVPESTCPNINITFYLYTSNAPTIPEELYVDKPQSILNANFIPRVPIKFIIHGYTGHKDYSPNMELRPAYFRNKRKVNIITVDYGKLALEGCYLEAVENTDLVAKCSSELIDKILDIRHDISLYQFHLLGFSLGSHIAGKMANYIQHGKFSRTTGLDPALPMFFAILTSKTQMLNKGDAKFVDVIHTNPGIKGKYFPIGDVDFYANSATFQPGCEYNTSCSHVRAVEYYAESINTRVGFWARHCSYFLQLADICGIGTQEWDLFGEFTDPNARGEYYFKTNDKPEYAIQISRESDTNNTTNS